MIWFYRLLFIPGFFLALPYYALRMWRRGGYRKCLQHRFGCFDQLPPIPEGCKRVWLQAVSVGEVLAIGPLVEALQKNQDVEVVLTTTTSTGYAEALKHFQGKVFAIGIFPLDFAPFSALAWKRICPDAVILMEGELWPEHLHRAACKNIPAFLVNARMSDKSFARYGKCRLLAKWLLGQLIHIYAASEHDRQRLIKLGASPETTVASGSIKLDAAPEDGLDTPSRSILRQELGFITKDTRPCFVLAGASTWPGEEIALLETQRDLIDNGIDCRLLLVPRHAERAGDIVKLLKDQSLCWHRRTDGAPPDQSIEIYLADTTGELARLIQCADLAFIGKSLPPNRGGQTPIEAAGSGIAVLMGPEMGNFKTVAAALLRNDAAKTVENASILSAISLQLANDPIKREAMGQAAQNWHKRNLGSSQRIAEGILTELTDEE